MEDEGRRNVSMSARSFQDFDRDTAARKEAEHTWYSFKTENSGEKALADARYGMVLRSAEAPAVATAHSAVESRRGLGLSQGVAGTAAAPAEESKSRLMLYAQQSQFIGGKTFFQNDKLWIDSAIQRHPEAKRIRVQFGSTEYFDLIAKNKKALQWLALGQNVQFVLDKTIYEIYE
jgi:hypothetical protein